MNATPLHPAVVHLPIALAVLMPLVAAGSLLAWWKGWLPQRIWAIAFIGQLLLVASSLVALRTGEADEDRAERFASEAAIEAHEEAAEAFTWSAVAILVLIGLPLALPERRRMALASVATAATLAVLAMGYRAGHAGGSLVHAGGASATPLPARGGDHDDHDDHDDD